MTKERLSRLIELSTCCVSREAFAELDALQAEFDTWDPDRIEQERDVAVRQLDEAQIVARAAYWNVPTLIMDLPTGKCWHKEKYPWLNRDQET